MTKVMLVDDDQTMVSLMQTLLELDGYEVVTARTGTEVVAKAEAERPQIMMIDFHLTDMEGVEVVRELRAHPVFANLPILMASGLDVREEVMAAGANEFIVKPFDPGDLPIIFNRLLGS
ncbi:MAG: response regulator [Anaerolineae bacterium]|nr:response regulator [Anaerolineae bacterium]